MEGVFEFARVHKYALDLRVILDSIGAVFTAITALFEASERNKGI